MKEQLDPQGNRYVRDGARLLLFLKGESRQRLIGTIDKSRGVMYIKRDKEKHLHWKSDSLGFNHFMIENATSFDRILLTYRADGQNFVYNIPVAYIKEHGNFMNFKAKQQELQLFVSLKSLEPFLVK